MSTEHASDALEPVFCRQPRDIGCAAGHDGDAVDDCGVERQVEGQRDAAGRQIRIMGQGAAHHFGLLVDLLRHEMAVVALVDRVGGGQAFLLRPGDTPVRLVIELSRCPGQHHPVAVVEIGYLVGEGRERQRVRAEIHLAVAIAHRQGRPAPRPDEKVGLASEQKSQGECAVQLRQRRCNRLDGRATGFEFGRDEMRHDLGIGLRREAVTLGGRDRHAARGSSR